MTRRFARCLGGARIHEGTPEGDWQIVTILGAMSLGGMIATMTVAAATDTDIFLAYWTISSVRPSLQEMWL